MAEPQLQSQEAHNSSLPAFALLAILCVAWAGCANPTFQAAKLPAELQAPIVDNPQTIDLSRLASFAVSSELIDRGDVLELSLVTGYEHQRTMTAPIRVGDDGTANVPLVGRVELAGLEMEGAEQAIAVAGIQRGVFRNPHVTVTMKQQRMNRITVLGAVEKPGVYNLPRGSSALLAALIQAGGLSKDAGTDVELRRPQRQGGQGFPSREPVNKLASFTQAQPVAVPATSVRVNLVSAAQQGRGGYYLDDGDVVMVEKRDPKPISVLGLVKKPGQFDLPANKDVKVLDALALAGGLDVPWADKVLIVRQVAGKDPVQIGVSVSEAKKDGAANLRLAPGDIVSVEQTPATVLYDTIRVINFGVGGTVPLF